MRAADGHLQNYRFAGRVPVSHLDPEISRGREHLLIVEVNLITANAMVVPWLVIIPCIRAKGVEDAVEIMQVFKSNVLLNELDFGRLCAHRLTFFPFGRPPTCMVLPVMTG